MSRFSNDLQVYASIDDLQHAFLIQIRRFKRACAETAGVVSLNPGAKTKTQANPSTGLAKLALMHDQIALLQNMSGQLRVRFPGLPKAITIGKQIDSLVSTIDNQAVDLHRNMSGTTKERIDPEIIATSNEMKKSFLQNMGKNLTAVKQSYLYGNIVTPHGVEVPAYVAYIRLDDLRGPSGPGDYISPHYFVMLGCSTATSDSKGNKIPKFLVAVSPEFRVPGRIRWMANADDESEAIRLAHDMLVRDGVIGKSTSRAIPLPKENIQFAHDNVKGTAVSGNAIVISVKNPKEIQQTQIELYKQLQALVKEFDPKNRDLIRYKIIGNKIYFIFSLPGRMRGHIIGGDVLDRIQRILGAFGNSLQMSPREIQRVRTALEDSEQPFERDSKPVTKSK